MSHITNAGFLKSYQAGGLLQIINTGMGLNTYNILLTTFINYC